jgi:hypothetical protein
LRRKGGERPFLWRGHLALSFGPLAVLKIVFAFRYENADEKNEQLNFVLYSAWIVLGLGYAMVTFAESKPDRLRSGIGLALSGLLAFFLDYHFYGQD